MEYNESKAKAAVILDSLISSFSKDGQITVSEEILQSTFENIFTGAYEAGKRDGIEFVLMEAQKNK